METAKVDATLCHGQPESDGTTGRQRTGYSHDAQCVIYRGPDEDYQGREICFGANETVLSISDVTDRHNQYVRGNRLY